MMDNTIREIFESHRSKPNQRLAALIARVESKYALTPAQLEDDALELVSAAGEPIHPLVPKEEQDG